MRNTKVYSILYLAALVLLLFVPQSLATVTCDLTPYGGAATVDGDNSEWNCTIAPPTGEMLQAWKKAALSEFWLSFDCNNERMYVLVMAKYKIVVQSGDEVYLKLNGSTVASSSPTGSQEFAWIGKSGGYALGWEASFPLSEESYDFTIHNNALDSKNAIQTAGLRGVTLCADCSVIAISLRAFEAEPCEQGVLLTWDVETEYNHAGYNIYRCASPDGNYIKVNSTLITGETETGSLSYEFIDTQALPGENFYKLEDVSLDGVGTFHGPVSANITSGVATRPETVAGYALAQNYPNPFNPITTIGYTIPATQFVTLEIFDLRGNRVRTLVSEEQRAGVHAINWDATNENGEAVASGLYIYRIIAGDFQQTARMTFLK